MRGTRGGRSRTRGSWVPRLAGLGFVLLLACAGVAAYLITGGTHATKTAAVLPTKVLSTQAVGLVGAGPAPSAGGSPAPEMLLASQAGLVFAAAGPGGAEWTSDQMAGGTYIFIYLPNGLCLAARAPGRASAVALKRCNLQAGQRWQREHETTGAGGVAHWQLRNASDGRCLTASRVIGTGESAAQLEPCQASPGSPQLIAFLTAP